MPFGVRKGGADCPYEVFNSDTGKRAEGGCHPDRAAALAHQRALQKNVPDAEAEDAAVTDAEVVIDPREPQPGEHFHAVAHTEGQSTGLRTFTNLNWRELPYAYHWQKASSAHGGVPQVVQVGLVTRAFRDPEDNEIIHNFGRLDLDDDDGVRYGRKLANGFARWVSIGLDEMPTEETIEWPEPAEGEDDDPLAMMFGKPRQVTIDGGMIAELTGVSVPAQADATVEPTPELIDLIAGLGPAAAMEENECPEGQHWDEEAQDCVPDEESKAPPFTKKAADTDAGSKRKGMRIRRYGESYEIERDDEPEAARSQPENMADLVQALTAAAHRIEIPNLPPPEWFDEPTDVDIPGAFCVTDEGRIYGILAPLNTNHRAYAKSGRRMTVPNRNVDYERFMGGEALTTQGRLSGVGPVTMDCGHAPRFRLDGEAGPRHYENACTIVAKVRVGETAEGLPWVAGALEPSVTPDEVSRMLACRLSGDWQPHPDKAGWDELVATLLVPSPGFAMGRTGPTLTTKREENGTVALVASSVPVRFVEHGEQRPFDGDGVEAILASADAAGVTEWQQRARRLNDAGLSVSAQG